MAVGDGGNSLSVAMRDNSVAMRDNSVAMRDNSVAMRDNSVAMRDNVRDGAWATPLHVESQSFSGGEHTKRSAAFLYQRAAL